MSLCCENILKTPDIAATSPPVAVTLTKKLGQGEIPLEQDAKGPRTREPGPKGPPRAQKDFRSCCWVQAASSLLSAISSGGHVHLMPVEIVETQIDKAAVFWFCFSTELAALVVAILIMDPINLNFFASFQVSVDCHGCNAPIGRRDDDLLKWSVPNITYRIDTFN